MAQEPRPAPVSTAFPPGDGRGASPIAGRKLELALLDQCLEQAREGRGSVVLVSGEPGIGKSRLCREAADMARQAGFLCVTGHCDEILARPPFGPWVEVLEGILRRLEPGEARERLGGPAAREIARLVPEVREIIPDLNSVGDWQSDAGERPLFAAVAGFLERSARARPLLIQLEDLHWADESALRLLLYLARRVGEVPILVLATHRDAAVLEVPDLAKTTDALRREGLAIPVALGPLTEDDVVEMLQALGAGPPPSLVAPALLQASEGNPFFLQQLVIHLLEEGKLFDAAGHWVLAPDFRAADIPDTVRRAIELRLARLSPACRDLLACAAPAARVFEYEVVREVCDQQRAGLPSLAPEDLIGAIEEACAAHLIEEVRPAGTRATGPSARPRDTSRLGGRSPTAGKTLYAFVHELTRQAILGGIPQPRQQRLRLATAEALERIHAGNLDPYIPALASLYRAAGDLADPQKVIAYAIRAGRAAQALYAIREAISHFSTALNLLERNGPDPRSIARLQLRVGTMLAGMPEFVDSPRAMVYFRAAETVLVGGPEDRDLAALYAGMAACYSYSGPCSDTLEYSWRAMELASRLGEEGIWAAAAVNHGRALVGHCGEVERGLHLLQEATHAATRSAHPARFFGVFATAMAEFSHLEDPVSVQLRIVNWLEQSGEPPGSYLHDQLGMLAEEAAVIAGDLNGSGGGRLSFIPRALAGIWRGDWAESESFLHSWDGWAHANGSQFNRAFSARWLGRLHFTTGDYQQAIAASTRALEIADEQCIGQAMGERPGLAMAYAALGRLGEARAEIERCREVLALGEDWRGAAGRVTLAEAVLAAAERRVEDAEGLLAQAILVLRRYHLPWEEAAGLLLWAQLLSAHGHRYRVPALERVNAAVDIYTRHGAGQPLIDRALAIRAGIAGDGDPAAAYPDRLTAREVQVLRLIVAGRSDREIAEQLVLSVRTVGRHVTNIYNKIGAHSRADATAYAIRHGIA